jgi:hypothetical protein
MFMQVDFSTNRRFSGNGVTAVKCSREGIGLAARGQIWKLTYDLSNAPLNAEEHRVIIEKTTKS